jgi:GNAT superfamily N-acetyltransferase
MDEGPQRPVGGLGVRPPAGVALRPAAREDRLAALAILGARAGPSRPDLTGDDAVARWEALISSIDTVPYVATAGGEAAGLLLLVFRRRLNFATWEGWVPELVVAEPFRGRGIGRALLRVAIEEWRLRGAHRLAVDLEEGEEAGAALLARMGFEDAFIRLRAEPMAVRGRSVPAGIEVRGVQADDVQAATRLIAQMGPRHSPVPDRMDAVARTFRQLVGRPADRSVLALRAGAPVGICTAELRPTLRRRDPELWIPELVVDEPARGAGIGAALLDTVLAVGLAASAGSAILESGPGRATAHSLYRSAGFVEAGRVFTLFRDR